jgi:hypothetical protein
LTESYVLPECQSKSSYFDLYLKNKTVQIVVASTFLTLDEASVVSLREE